MSDVSEPVPPTEERRKRAFFLFAIVVLTATLVALAFWWFAWRGVETTDDAFIDGRVAQVSPQVSGRVAQIIVADNQHVKKGQLLLTLDARDRQVALDKALAAKAVNLARQQQYRAEVVAREASLAQSQANVQLAEAGWQRDQKEYQRYRDSGSAVSQSDLDSKSASARSSAASLLSERKGVGYGEALLKKAQAALAEIDAALRQDDAAIADARLLLSYTRLVAPFNGYVTRRAVEQGDYLSAGQLAMRLVSDEVWVTANFKENQLRHMRPGQQVSVRVDARPQQRFNARVQSMQRATGSLFNLLPAENATGNFVKIVQRVPVKIVFTDQQITDYPLSPGMSVVPDVDVSQ